MKISLEQVDEVISRTNATYEVAKKALEESGGDVLEAIILLESEEKKTFESGAKFDKFDKLGEDFIDGLKDLINKGNVTKILMKKDDKTILNIPITAGALGAYFFTTAAISGVLVGLATGCRLEIIKEDGEVIDINEITEETINNLKQKLSSYKDKVTKKEEKDTFNDEEAETIINIKLVKNDEDSEDDDEENKDE